MDCAELPREKYVVRGWKNNKIILKTIKIFKLEKKELCKLKWFIYKYKPSHRTL